jgi:serine/threonine protein kinase/tetratricopeptide (TPR) repeat protein
LTLTSGTRLGPYEIVAPLGVGGMGEVYRATDTNLKRQVAIKVLPASVAGDPERLIRFQREAEVLASLNHPNIASIHGLEKSNGIIALVMELVEGPTLADRIAKSAIPIDEALPIAKQIADALQAAHEQGIVHRDLKPANIKLRPDGTVKVLDFGLAKSTEASRSSVHSAISATVTSPAMMTGPGMILGTASYMSPEQARGKPVDKQTDIWAFGCVLYEMFTGRVAFGGETISDTLAKVLEREPDWQALAASTPVKISELLHRCLMKDQQRRLHDIADARIEIEDALTAQHRPRLAIEQSVAMIAVMMALALLAGAWWYVTKSTLSTPRDSVTVLIADFDNRTNDPTFDHTLEPILKLVLESAGFIGAYDRGGMRTLGVRPPDTMDEHTAQEIAVKQGLGVVVSGSVARQGSGYEIAVKATQAVTGNVLASTRRRASSKDQALNVITRLATEVREALGDDTSDDTKRFANETLSVTSLEVVRHYASAMGAMSNGKFEHALRSYAKAVALDPKFGIGYQGMAVASRGLDRQQDAEKYIKQALEQVDGMTERERYRTRALYYGITGDFQNCVNEYGQLVAKYAADASARNNLAVCSNFMRDMKRAVAESREVLKILPKRPLYHINLALHAAYAGDFETADREARIAQTLGSAVGLQPLVLAQLAQGHLGEAVQTYQAMGRASELGESYLASGLGDLAIFEGRLMDAVRILQDGAAADMAEKELDKAAGKLAALSYAQLTRGQKRAAVDAAENALKNSSAVKIRFLAARTFVEAGESAKARTLAAGLASELQAEPQSYAKIIQGDIALKDRDPRQAIKLFLEANALLNTWISRFDLGRAYLEAGAYPQADSEFEQCINRRGEALSLFLDEEPTWGYLPPVYYYQGRVREGLKTAGFAESYRAYLDIRGKAGEDPLLAEVRRRVGN